VGRILGLDYGRKRVGVSVSDPLGLTAQPVETWKGLRCEDVVEKTRILVETPPSDGGKTQPKKGKS